MKTIKFEELEPGMLITHGPIGAPALIVDINPYDPFAGRPSIGLIKLETSFYGRTYNAVSENAHFEILYERDSRCYQEIIKKIEGQRRQYIKDAEEDCEMLRRFLDG